MNLFNKKKKGFTIVELVIVIAVIGVLAAILIPTFVGLVNKAHVAADGTLIRELNNAIAMDLAEKGEDKHETMYDALQATEKNGFVVQRIKSKTNTNKILWDSVHGVFCYLQEGADVVEYVPGSVEEGKELHAGDYRLWTISNAVDPTYSTYLYKATAKTFTTDKGFDAGDEDVTSVTYARTGDAQEVVIRTNGGELTIQAPNDDVHHYGYADSVNVIDVATSSYHEKGEVKFLEVAAGHIVLEAEAEVSAFHFTATEGEFKNAENKTISIDISNLPAEKLPEFSRDAVTIAENGTYVAEVKSDSTEYIWLFGNGIKEQMVVTETTAPIATNGELKSGVTAGCETGSVAEQIANPAKRNEQGQLVNDNNEVVTPAEAVVEEVASKEEVQTGATLFAGGTGSINNPFIISNANNLSNIGKGLATGISAYYLVVNDIALSDESRIFDDDYGYYNIVEDTKQDIHLNLNKHTISNINGCIFDVLYHIEAYNGKLSFNANTKNAALVEVIRHKDEGATAYFHDLSIEGTALINEDHWGPLVCYMYGCNTNNSTISADKILVNLNVRNSLNDSYSGGLFGYIQGSKISASITNCQVNGSIQGPYAYGFFNGCCYPEGAVVVNSGNILYGSLLGSKGVGIFGLNGNYDISNDTPAKQDNLVTNNGQMAKVSSTNTLINNYETLAIGDQIVISNNNDNVAYVTVSIVYWTNRASDGTGGYPNNIDTRIDVNGETGTFESGLYMNRIVQSTSKNDGNNIIDESYRQVWKDGNKYMVYQDNAVFSSSKVQIHVYAYNENGIMITYQSMQYNAK